MLNSRQVKFLQGLVKDRATSRTASEVAQLMAEQFGVGMRRGRKVVYRECDFLGAAQLLVANGVPKTAGEAGRRADRAEYSGLSEKSGAVRPHADSVALRAAWGRPMLSDVPLTGEHGCYQVVTVERALRVKASRILVVENLETFRWLGRQRWIDYGAQPTLAVFRGDNATSPSDSSEFLAKSELPVWAFFDFDPAGLGMASSLPRLQRLVLPEFSWLEDKTRSCRRSDLMDASERQWQRVLNDQSDTQILKAWKLLCRLRSGLPQEWMESAPRMATL